jgi:hypothetical protein
VGLRAAWFRGPPRPRSAARRSPSPDRLLGRRRSVSRPLRHPGHGGRHQLSGDRDRAGLRRAHLGLGHRA